MRVFASCLFQPFQVFLIQQRLACQLTRASRHLRNLLTDKKLITKELHGNQADQKMMMMMTLKEVRPTVVRGLALQA